MVTNRGQADESKESRKSAALQEPQDLPKDSIKAKGNMADRPTVVTVSVENPIVIGSCSDGLTSVDGPIGSQTRSIGSQT